MCPKQLDRHIEGFADWWQRVQALASFQATQPNAG